MAAELESVHLNEEAPTQEILVETRSVELYLNLNEESVTQGEEYYEESQVSNCAVNMDQVSQLCCTNFLTILQ